MVCYCVLLLPSDGYVVNLCKTSRKSFGGFGNYSPNILLLIKIIILSLAHGTRHKRCTFWHICCREMRIHSFILSVLLYLLLVQFYSIYELPILTIDVSPTLLGEAKHMIS